MGEPLPFWCDLVPTPFPEVRLHRIDLAAARGDYMRLANLLAVTERDRAGLFRVADDRIRFVVTRAVLRLVLAEAGLGLPETLTIVAGAHGKPELLHSTPLRFNVAHAGEVALVALAEGREVGVDVEVARDRPDLDDVAARFFASAEAEALARCEGGAHAAAFHRCWVRKEACVKAAGLGLRLPLAEVVVGVEPRSAPWRVDVVTDGASCAFEVADVAIRAGYAAAVAIGPRHDVTPAAGPPDQGP